MPFPIFSRPTLSPERLAYLRSVHFEMIDADPLKPSYVRNRSILMQAYPELLQALGNYAEMLDRGELVLGNPPPTADDIAGAIIAARDSDPLAFDGYEEFEEFYQHIKFLVTAQAAFNRPVLPPEDPNPVPVPVAHWIEILDPGAITPYFEFTPDSIMPPALTVTWRVGFVVYMRPVESSGWFWWLIREGERFGEYHGPFADSPSAMRACETLNGVQSAVLSDAPRESVIADNYPVNLRDQARDVSKLRRWQPLALNIRYEGRCDSCHHEGLHSYQLPGDKARDTTREDCGYWCAACGFSNAGAREIEVK